ncbi:LamG-like jellyroll fold domain-containing protein [Flaviaesturariibacter aridisoli]|uniref:LamG domain-containing protein n=1 Tax=Flaviaesturariibacter aridisoli TaxID=2545761 RepID=A0A4R4E4T5_9BACT|nr:LamG-like jellyroll fold domain-containing protein [Flaviaesturariibacter aridisoli]TCZ72240.1 hypothetical protein E0486_09115 [Flaviaesturariibacter aridisoli]
MNKMTSRLTVGALTLLMGGMMMTSCKKKDNDVAPPDPIGGFNNSNEVGAATLKAHWTFNGTLNEGMSNTAPTSSAGTSFVSGPAGSQALGLNNGYVLYPSIAALNVANIGSITVSAWVKTANNGTTATTSVFALTQSAATQSDWNTGPVNMYLENNKPVAYNDTLVFHSAFSTYSNGNRRGGDNINDYGVRETDFKTVKGANRWVHYVMRYDGTGSNIDIFADGVLVSNNNFRHRTDGNPPVGLGGIVGTTPYQSLIGAFPNANTGFANSAAQTWQGLFNGQIDELRVWYSALSDTDISSLYQLEKAGR